MANMCPTRFPMPNQDPNVRNKNFDEVALGYTPELAMQEATRCLGCRHKPCFNGCPVGIDIPAFIHKVAEGDFAAAYEILSQSTTLAAVCGRVCPQETQCEGVCVRGRGGEPVAIGRLERFVADYHHSHGNAPTPAASNNGIKIAVVGSGPSGLACAADLARLGYEVTVFEALHTPGGVLVYGIPEFRLPKSLVELEIENLKAMGVKFLTNMVIGKILTVDELLNEEGFQSVYLASGAGLPSFMGIPGEGLNGVYSANEYLTRVNLMKAYLPDSKTPITKSRAVAIIGGGNVAMDAARCAKRLGADSVYIVYRRGRDELPARLEEIEHAEEEGIEFKLLASPVEVLGDEHGHVCGLRCATMELGAPDDTGRRRPIQMEGQDFVLEIDAMVMSIGTAPNPLIASTTPGLDINKYGCIVTNGEDGLTSRPNVYAGGDAVMGAATVILAMGAGKSAAAAIHASFQK